jgi:hypothetical protein
MKAKVIFGNTVSPKDNSLYSIFNWGYYVPQYLLFIVNNKEEMQEWVQEHENNDVQKSLVYVPTGRKVRLSNQWGPYWKNVGMRVKFELQPAGSSVTVIDEKEEQWIDVQSVDSKISAKLIDAEIITENHALIKLCCKTSNQPS